MATAKKATIPAPQNKRGIKMLKDVEHPTVYSNFMGVGATPFDVSILFAEVQQGDGETGIALPRVKILLAPEQAANLAQMLATILVQYVSQNGQLRASGKFEGLTEIPTDEG